jgi:NUMOD4 motif.
MSSAPIIGEVWKTIPSHPSYAVSSMGRVKRQAIVHGGMGSVRIPTGTLAVRALPRGHLQVTMSENNAPVTRLVHRLVAEAFLPPPQEGQDCVCHRDDDPSNNRPDNLFWGTREDNTADMVAKGRQARGRRVTSCKLTEDAVRAIRSAARSGQRQDAIAVEHGISQSNVSMIVTGATWGHVS